MKASFDASSRKPPGGLSTGLPTRTIGRGDAWTGNAAQAWRTGDADSLPPVPPLDGLPTPQPASRTPTSPASRVRAVCLAGLSSDAIKDRTALITAKAGESSL